MIVRRWNWALTSLLAVFAIAFDCSAQPAASLGPPIATREPSTGSAPAALLPVVRSDTLVVVRGATPAAEETAVPLTLGTTLRLAQFANLDIAQTRAVVDQAIASLTRAEVAWIPNLNVGSSYTRHDGNIQKTEGNIIKANRDTLFLGGGPSLSVQLSDSIFGPLIARRLASASEAGLQAVSNDTILAVADAYFNVLRARRRLARIDDILENLTSDRPTALRAESKGLLPLVRDFVEVGRKEALKADLARVEVEIARRKEEREGALQEFAVAQAELARLLRIDPRTPLWPGEDFRTPMAIPTEQWLARSLDDLLTFALRNRPELAQNQALMQAAIERVRQARIRPLLPTLNLGYNYGDFGGDPNLKPNLILPPLTKGGPPRIVTQTGFGPSGRINHFAPRTDFDASVVWRLQNFGFGNRAEVREQQAAERQATLRGIQTQDRVVTQVVQTHEQIQAWKKRLDVARAALFDESGKPAGPVFQSVRLNFDRIRGAEGRPLEVLDSIRSLNDTLDAYGQAVTEYERSRFRLLIALGLPARSIIDSFDLPVNCPPAIRNPVDKP